MNKLSIALSLGLLSAVPAFAAPVTIDAGNFELTYQNDYGLNLVFAGGVFTLSGTGLSVSAGAQNPEDAALISVDSYNGKPYPILITPKAGYQISGVTETIFGNYSASVGQAGGSMAVVGAALTSYWVSGEGLGQIALNAPAWSVSLTAGQAPVQGTFSAAGTLGFNGAEGSVALSALTAYITAVAGNGQASGELTKYQLGVAVTPVPEPEALGLLLAGLGVVGFTMARRRAA